MKKFLCLAAAFLMAISLFAFAGCGGKDTVEGVSLSKQTLQLEVGDTFQLSVLVSPSTYDGAVTWKSDDEKVATVDDGLISAVSAGSAKITAAAGGKSASCTVAVTEPVQIETINGFKAFEKGGLLGGEGGEYFPVTAQAVGSDSVKYSGKGGLSWPDTVNNAEPDCMGGYYDEALELDGLKIKYTLDQPMDFTGDHWYFISLADRKQLFNNWNGEDPVKTLFFMIVYEDGNIKLKPHYHDLLEMGEGWSYLGESEGVPADSYSMPVTIELNETAAGYEVYLNGELQWFDAIKSSYITVTDELFPDGKCYLMAGAHIGNPGSQYEGEYAFTIGLDKSASQIVNVQSVSFKEEKISLSEGESVQVQTVVLPENATNKTVEFASEDVLVATVDADGRITAVGVGETVISATVQGISGECSVTVTQADVPVTGLTLDRSEISIRQFEEITLSASVQPADASNRSAVWKVEDGASNVTVQPDPDDPLKAVIRGNHIGDCTVQVTLGGVSDECEVTVLLGSLNGFVQFEKGGLVNETEYRSDITMNANGSQDRVQFKGYGGTNWGDANSAPSTMGGMYSQALPINETEVYYSVDQWIDGATEHFYIIALSNAPEWFSDKQEGNGTVFFLFAFNGGSVTLNAHYVGEGRAWTQIGISQGIAATGGQYVIRFTLSGTGLRVRMRNAESEEFTELVFGQTEEIDVDGLFPDGEAYLMAGAYAKTYAAEWAFTLGCGAYDPEAGE